MTSTGVQIASFDAGVYGNYPTQNFGTQTSITLNSTGPVREGYFYFALPAALPGDTIVSATFKLYQKGVAAGGSRTLTVQRAAAAWTSSKIKFNNRPSGTGATATRNLGNGGASGREWSFDVTALIAQVAAGAAWYGFRVTSNNATALAFFARDAASFRPTLEVVYESDVEAPTNLIPSNDNAVSIARPTLQWASLLADTIAAYQVQIDDVADFSSPLVDTGQVFSTLPEYSLTTDLTAGTTYSWRVKIWNDAGVESDYSDVEQFTRTAKPTLAIDNPAADPNDFVTDATPPFAWTLTGGTQTKFQVIVEDVTATPTILHDSNPITGVDDDYSPPNEIRFDTTSTYRVTVRVWDDVARAATPGDPPWVEASRDFTFVLDASVSPVATLVAATDDSPYVTLTLTRATAPDFFQVFAAGVPLSGRIEPSDVFVSGTTYEIGVRNLIPRKAYPTLTVVCIVNGVTSTANPTVAVTTEPTGIWLTDLAGVNPVCIHTDDSIGSWSSGEVSAVHAPVGSPYSVILWQTRGARNGEHSGYLVGDYADDPTTIETWKARFEALTSPLGQKLLLSLTDSAIPVYIRKPLMAPANEHGDVLVTFEAYERPPD